MYREAREMGKTPYATPSQTSAALMSIASVAATSARSATPVRHRQCSRLAGRGGLSASERCPRIAGSSQRFISVFSPSTGMPRKEFHACRRCAARQFEETPLNPHFEDVQQRRRTAGEPVETCKGLSPRKHGRLVMSTKGGLANRNGPGCPWVPRLSV